MWKERVCVITGATSGIGRQTAIELARRGAEVWGIGRNAERLASLKEALDAAGDAPHQVRAVDVASEAEMGAFAEELKRRGRADLLVASAVAKLSGFPPRTKDLTLAEWNAQIETNLYGLFLANQAVIPLMLAQEDGDIVNMSSSTTPQGLRGTPLAPAYCATKFAIADLCRSMAEELGPEGIRVRAIYPGSIDTPLIADTMLDGPYGGKMRVESFAKALVGMLELSRLMDVQDPFLLPVPKPDAATLAQKERR